MKKLLLVLLLCSTSAQADNDWVAPLFGGILLGNAMSRPYSQPYYVPQPVYIPPPVYVPIPVYSNEYYREQEVRRIQLQQQYEYNRGYNNGYNSRYQHYD